MNPIKPRKRKTFFDTLSKEEYKEYQRKQKELLLQKEDKPNKAKDN